MTKEQYKWELEGYINAYPLRLSNSSVNYLSLNEQYNVISVAALIISRDIGLSWENVVNVMCEMRGFTGTRIPDVKVAERELKLRPGYIQDWNSVQNLKERNTKVMQGIENLVKSYIIEYKR